MMVLESQKFEKFVNDLSHMRFVDMQQLSYFQMHEPTDTTQPIRDVPKEIHDSTLKINDWFIGYDKYLWIDKTVTIPTPKKGFEVIGRFDFGATNPGTNNGFESLLYIDGHPYQGVDANHKMVVLEPFAGKEIKMSFLLWTGLSGQTPNQELIHRIKEASLGSLHKKTDALYFLAKAIMKTILLLPNENTARQTLIQILNSAYQAIDWDRDYFYASVDHAYSLIESQLKKTPKLSEVTLHYVGHTHIDVAWLWRLKHTREKAMRSFSTVLRLMEEFEDYKFLQTQPQLYQYIKEDSPEIYAKIKQRIAEGKWEVDGGMWVEADCNIVSGESLSRQFLYGTRFIENEFNKKCEFLWLPDVFGYSWALPQILELCEMKTFMTSKLSMCQFNKLPHDLFVWKGIDGSEITAYFIDTPYLAQNCINAQNSFEKNRTELTNPKLSTYNDLAEPESGFGAWLNFKDKQLSNEVLISYGHGDGGGGVNRDMLKNIQAMQKVTGFPNVKTTTAGAFVNKIHEKLKTTDAPVHEWDGELYFEYHRGTYTTQAYNKKMNRILENKLFTSEWLSTLAMQNGETYRQADINKAWEILLLNQFHDIIPGSSIRQVYEDSKKQYEAVSQTLDGIIHAATSNLIDAQKDCYTMFNPGNCMSSQLILIEETRDGFFKDINNNILDSAKTDNGYLIAANCLPLDFSNITFVASQPKESGSTIQIKGNTAETPFYIIAWNNDGHLTSLYDKQNKREVLSGSSNTLIVYEDRPLAHDAWDIDLYHFDKAETLACASSSVTEQNSLRTIITFEYTYRKSTIKQNMVLYEKSRRIDFETDVNWNAENRLLKASFDVDIRNTKATYDIQYGHCERPTHYNTSWDYAKFEVVAHKWIDLSEKGYGVSLLNNCKYGHNVRGTRMQISLLRSPKRPDPQADMGAHNFTYALYPHVGDAVDGGTIEESVSLNQPALVVKGSAKKSLRRIIFSRQDHIFIDAVKKCEDCDNVLVRLHECKGKRGAFVLESDFAIESYTPCNILEHAIGETIVASRIEDDIKPFKIKNYIIRFTKN